MQCPVCQTTLKIVDRQGIEIDYCPQCRGVWLDRGELDKLIERSMQAENQYRDRPPAQYREDEREYRYDDDDDYKHRSSGQYPHEKPKRKSSLSEIFDIFG